MSFNRSKSQQSSQPTSVEGYQQYFSALNSASGGKVGDFFQNGTTPLTEEQIRAVGGAGATRENAINQARERALEEITADPNLDVSQRVRAKQLTSEDSQSRLDAIAKETEAALTDVLRYNNDLSRQDMETLARIFYGPKATTSQGTSQGNAGSFWG